MNKYNAEKQLCDFAVWLLAVTALLVMLTSCSPYDGLTTPVPAAATATGTATATGHQDDSPTATPAPRVCIVSTGVQAGNLNIRSGPGTSSAVIGILHERQKLTLTDEPARAGWLQVTAANVTGWVNGRYCAVQDGEQ